MGSFGGPRAKRHVARLKFRRFRRGRFKIAEVAEGFDVHRQTLMQAINRGLVPHEKVGRRYWLNSESVVAFMKLGHALKL